MKASKKKQSSTKHHSGHEQSLLLSFRVKYPLDIVNLDARFPLGYSIFYLVKHRLNQQQWMQAAKQCVTKLLGTRILLGGVMEN